VTSTAGWNRGTRRLCFRCWVKFVVPVVIQLIFADRVHAAATPWVGDKKAEARLISAVRATGNASAIDAGLEIRMAPGWHTYWRTPGDAGFATTLDWKASANVALAELAWPAPTRLVAEGSESYVYPDHVVLPIRVKLLKPGGPVTLRASVDYAACAEICLPYHADLSLALPSGLATASEEAPIVSAAQALVPRTLIEAQLDLVAFSAEPIDTDNVLLTVQLSSTGAPFRQPELFVEGMQSGRTNLPDARFSEDRHAVGITMRVSGETISALTMMPLTLTVTDGVDRAAEFVAAPAFRTAVPH
jgi:suppressor for copper-sensitivity B